MHGFTLNMKSGWDGQAGVPADFSETLRHTQTGAGAGPYLIARSWNAKGALIHPPDRTDLEKPGGASLLFDNIGWLLTQLENPDLARAELIFVHPKAMKPGTAAAGVVQGRPEPREESGTTVAALERFVNAVADSLHPSGTHGAWASCEWATLEFTPAIAVAA